MELTLIWLHAGVALVKEAAILSTAKHLASTTTRSAVILSAVKGLCLSAIFSVVILSAAKDLCIRLEATPHRHSTNNNLYRQQLQR